MALVTERALVLRRYPWGESSLVVHLLTPRRGRIHLAARGAFRPTARYFATLDLFDTLEVEYSIRPQADLGNLRQASIKRRRPHVCRHLPSYRAGLAALELADIAARADQAEGELFRLTEAALERLETRGTPIGQSRVIHELEFLGALGLAPSLLRCAACGGEASTLSSDSARVPFSAGAGGRLCVPCAAEARVANRRVGTLPEEVLRTAAELLEGEASGLGLPELEPALVTRVRDFVERFLDYHLETRPRSHRAFLASPNRNAPDQNEASDLGVAHI